MAENEQEVEGTLAEHLSGLAVTAGHLTVLLSEPQRTGAMHPEALGEAARLSTSLRAVIHALTYHEHLAMGIDDVWKALSIEHRAHRSGEIT